MSEGRALTNLPIRCGVYSFYGNLQLARDGFFYIRSNEGTRQVFEIRVAGIPRDKIPGGPIGIKFYNPKPIETKVSNNTVVFIEQILGTEENLNQADNKSYLDPTTNRWPKWISNEVCGKGDLYLNKLRASK